MVASFRSDCPIASTLDLVGDRWTLLVIRNLMLGAASYADLVAAPEKVATNILADRLERLQRWGLVAKADAPPGGRARGVYRLTHAGADLLPILQAAAAWGEKHLPGRRPTPAWFLAAAPDDFIEEGSQPGR
jgi:DNA-binding HxlR family transcriptional regulator